ncbi:MAG TPA: hypothetical protein VN976_21950 [Verrucomicrobiae bacterium]|nr:hypothetical protein [Verrucomicrobiae bacterium]
MPPLSSTAVLPGFPAPSGGDRLVSIVDHKGPASYTTVTAGTNPPSGGDILTAAECGLKYITAVSGQLSDDGTYLADASPGAGGGAEATSVVLIWSTANTGAQVSGATNLSARTVRFIVYGR